MCRKHASTTQTCGYVTQELGLANEWVSETIFTTLFVSFMLWTFSPFVMARKRFYTAVVWSRLLMVLVGESMRPPALRRIPFLHYQPSPADALGMVKAGHACSGRISASEAVMQSRQMPKTGAMRCIAAL